MDIMFRFERAQIPSPGIGSTHYPSKAYVTFGSNMSFPLSKIEGWARMATVEGVTTVLVGSLVWKDIDHFFLSAIITNFSYREIVSYGFLETECSHVYYKSMSDRQAAVYFSSTLTSPMECLFDVS